MAHNAVYFDRIEIEYDYETQRRYLVRTVRAEWFDKKHKELKTLDVYRELETGTWYEDERFFARNLVFASIGGWMVYFPNEKIHSSGYSYYGNQRAAKEPEDWQPFGTKRIGGCVARNLSSKKDIEAVLTVYPEFKYIIKKLDEKDRTNVLIMDLIEVFKEYPEIEGLVQLGLYRIALNRQLYKLSLVKRKQVIKFIMENHEQLKKWTPLRDIQRCIKYKIEYSMLEKYDHYCYGNRISIQEFLYLIKKKLFIINETNADQATFNRNNISLYADYLEMAKKVGHNMKDDYWHYPQNIQKSHAKVMEELKTVRETASKLKGEYLTAVLNPMMKKYNTQINGYDIFITDDMKVIQKQCDDLYQCLLRNGYIDKVLMQEEILVFIWKDGKPVATAEVFYNGKLGQFYGDESRHIYGDSCKPSDEVIEAFNIWFSKFKPIKVKAPKKNIHYYKGFYKMLDDDTFEGWNNYKFKIGDTYKTNFSDDEIYSAGGKMCNASNKVFHFCESITEISRHYNPTVYCEVEPLGALVEHNGALLSNKIKILRYIPEAEVKKIINQEKQLNII